MTAGRRRAKVRTGLHIVEAKRAKGTTFYVYAWRGGPCIHKSPVYPTITPELLEKQRAARLEAGSRSENDLDRWIDAYRESPEFTGRAPSTQRDYRLWLDRISARFGRAPLSAFTDSRMRGDILKWRNQWAEQPRTADKASVMMSTLLGWIVNQGHLAVNVAAGIGHLHSVNKSKEVWERRHMRAMTKAPAHLRRALMLAGLTGLRLGDLVRLDWSQIGKTAIIVEHTRKKDTRAVIPLLPETHKLLNKIGRKTEGPVLLNSRGTAWTESGLGSVFQKSKPKGFDRTMHDLRGTFATRLLLAGATDQQAADVMGWGAKEIAAIRRRYVDSERVVIELAEMMSRRAAL